MEEELGLASDRDTKTRANLMVNLPLANMFVPKKVKRQWIEEIIQLKIQELRLELNAQFI
jgi:hypothetical protein